MVWIVSLVGGFLGFRKFGFWVCFWLVGVVFGNFGVFGGLLFLLVCGVL